MDISNYDCYIDGKSCSTITAKSSFTAVVYTSSQTITATELFNNINTGTPCILKGCQLKHNVGGNFDIYQATSSMTGADVTNAGALTFTYSGYLPIG